MSVNLTIFSIRSLRRDRRTSFFRGHASDLQWVLGNRGKCSGINKWRIVNKSNRPIRQMAVCCSWIRTHHPGRPVRVVFHLSPHIVSRHLMRSFTSLTKHVRSGWHHVRWHSARQKPGARLVDVAVGGSGNVRLECVHVNVPRRL